jgi:hypothetical protein
MSQLFRGAVQIKVEDIVRQTGVSIAALGRDTLPYTELSPQEIEDILTVFNTGIEHLKKVAPKIAVDIERQRQLVVEFAAIAKATFPIRGKNYTFPSTPGNLGVAWLFPQAIKYAATPSATAPCYTSYANNSWDISLTAGTPAWLFGDGTNFYRTSSAVEARSFILVFENGVVEVGSSPAVEQFRLVSEGKTDYGIYTVEPLLELPVEYNVAIYQYPTPAGAIFVDFNRGIMWGLLPRVTKVATIKLLGMVFYEHNFAPTFKWIS